MIRLMDVIKQLDEQNYFKVYEFLISQGIFGLDFMVQIPVGLETAYPNEHHPFFWLANFGYPLGDALHRVQCDTTNQVLISFSIMPYKKEKQRIEVSNIAHNDYVFMYINNYEWKRISHVLQVLVDAGTLKVLMPLYRKKARSSTC